MKRYWKFWTVLTGLMAGLGWGGLQAATAADAVVLTYGFVSMEIPMDELTTFAETGEPSGELAQLLALAGQDPATLQTALTTPIPVNTVVLDLALNSPPGEWLLDSIGETIHPDSGVAGRSAMRAAIIGAAADDSTLTVLEVMQGYPSPNLVVRGDRLVAAYGELADRLEILGDLAKILEDLRQSQF